MLLLFENILGYSLFSIENVSFLEINGSNFQNFFGLYKNFTNNIKNYQFGEYSFMEACTPPDKELTYKEKDLTKLSGKIRKYYLGL